MYKARICFLKLRKTIVDFQSLLRSWKTRKSILVDTKQVFHLALKEYDQLGPGGLFKIELWLKLEMPHLVIIVHLKVAKTQFLGSSQYISSLVTLSRKIPSSPML